MVAVAKDREQVASLVPHLVLQEALLDGHQTITIGRAGPAVPDRSAQRASARSVAMPNGAAVAAEGIPLQDPVEMLEMAAPRDMVAVVAVAARGSFRITHNRRLAATEESPD